MDSIDITDSTFSLNVPDINEIISSGGGTINDYTMYIYIGVAILIILVGIFIYKYYQNKKSDQSIDDCPGGFCTMEQEQRQI